MYTPLYIKTDNSLQDSLITVEKLIEFAVKNNIKSLTITDNNMFGVMDFYQLCIKNNIKPIIGLEITFEYSKFILYAINYNGYKNLIKLATILSSQEIKKNILEQYSNDLIAIIPYESLNIYDSLVPIYKYIYKSYKNNEERGNLSGNNLIYMREVIYLNESDKKYIPYLEAIKNDTSISKVSSIRTNNNLKLESEIKEMYSSDLENNYFITNLVDIKIPMENRLMPVFKNELGISSIDYLKKECISGLKRLFGNTVKEVYQTRLKYELNIIIKMGFADYFLIVADYVNFAKSNNIIVGPGRGSAVGSLVAYCLGITDVDPVKYNLLFERFLNPERVSMPDIDIDFENDKREEVINYCINKYGIKKVAPIITFSTLGAKQAIRDVGKSMDLSLEIIDTFSKLIDSKKTLLENYNTNPKIKELLNRKEELKELYKIANVFVGLKRQTSIHAAGVVMSEIDLDEIIPLNKNHDFYTSGYDMTYLEKIGLLKMDFLAIRYLTIIHNMIDEINHDLNMNLNFDTIPLDDKDTINIFTTANTVGIFQFESDGMISFLRRLKASNLEDIFAAIALYRPGPMQNISSFIRRKQGKEKVTYLDPCLEPILKNTYGIMIYQEQIMQVAEAMASFSLGEADILRKAMSKKQKDLLLQEKDHFIEGSIKNGHSKEVANDVYELMLKFAEYGFNRSHSVGYSIVAYKMAYLKAHYPKHFITNLLSMEANNPNKTKMYIYEAKLNHIEILQPDINLSQKNFSIEQAGIRYPLSNIKNIGISAINSILEERSKGKFIDIFDFVSRTYGKSVNRKILDALIDAGVFTNFGYNRHTLHENIDAIINYGELIKDVGREFALKPEIKIIDEYSKKELMNLELTTFGFYLSNHPITEIKMHEENIINLNEIPLYFDKNIKTAIYIDRINNVETKNKTHMAFITGSDEITTIDAVLFPNIYSKYPDLKVGDILLIEAHVEKRYDKIQLVINKVLNKV